MTAPPGGWSTDEDGHARLTGHLHFTFEDPLSSLPETAQEPARRRQGDRRRRGLRGADAQVRQRARRREQGDGLLLLRQQGRPRRRRARLRDPRRVPRLTRPHEGRRPERAHPQAGRGDAAHGGVGRRLHGVLRAPAARAARRGAATPDGHAVPLVLEDEARVAGRAGRRARAWPTPICSASPSSSAPSSTASRSRRPSTRTSTSPTRTGRSRGCSSASMLARADA